MIGKFLQIAFCLAVAGTYGNGAIPLHFEDPIPAAYDPANPAPQFADVSPDMTLPKGHVYYKPVTKHGWTIEQVMAKGVTHWTPSSFEKDGNARTDAFRKNPLYATKEYYAVPRIREIFGLPGKVNDKWWPNGFLNEQQARDRARAVSIQPRLWVGETMEGDDWVPSDQPMWGWFYDELTKRYEAQKAKDGIPYYLAHNYFCQFSGDLQLGQGKREQKAALYDTSPEKWNWQMYAAGASIGKPNTILQGFYVGPPDMTAGQLMGALFGMELTVKAGKYAGLFVFNLHEWRPGFAGRIEYPEGIFYRSDKLPIDPNLQISLAFLGQEYGTIFIEWGLGTFMPPSMKPIGYYAPIHSTMDAWYAKGDTHPTPCPFYATSGSQASPMAYQGDMTHFGTVMWNATGGQVAGGTTAYATYRLDGKKWIQKEKNGSDLVNGYYDQRGIVRTRTLGKKMMICYFNFFADNEPHSIEIQNPTNPSDVYTGTVCGNGIHATVVNLR